MYIKATDQHRKLASIKTTFYVATTTGLVLVRSVNQEQNKEQFIDTAGNTFLVLAKDSEYKTIVYIPVHNPADFVQINYTSNTTKS